jgi:excisionase family DNA binding protein
MTQQDTTFLTSAEVADRLRVHVETVRRWARSGLLTPIRTPGGQMRFAAAEVDAFTRDTEAAG